jgi:hypothetical protein
LRVLLAKPAKLDAEIDEMQPQAGAKLSHLLPGHLDITTNEFFWKDV